MENGKLDPYKIETLEPIAIKFVTDYYVPETKLNTKFGANSSTGASGQ